MADRQEEPVGHVADAPQEKEAPLAQKDVVKENGELPAADSLAEIGGKEKEDRTVSSSTATPEVADSPAAAENGSAATPSEETAKVADSPSQPPQEESSSPSKEGKEAGKVGEEMPQPTDLHAQHGPSFGERIQEGFLSLVGLGKGPSAEAQPSPDVPPAEREVHKSEDTKKELPTEGEAPQSEETEKEAPAEGFPTADEPQVAEPVQTEQAKETTDTAQSEEHPESIGLKEAEVEEIPKSADTTETNEPIGVGEEKTTKPLERAQTDELKTQAAEEEIPRTLETTKAEPSGAEVAEDQKKEEQEQPFEGEEPSKPKSFFGVVLKPVGSNGKSSEVQPNAKYGTGTPSSCVLDSDNADKSPEEVHEKQSEAHLPADIVEQQTAGGNTAPIDVSHEKEAGQTEVEMESETTPREVSPEAFKEVSGGPEPSENATTETPESLEQGNADVSSKETTFPTSEVEENDTLPPAASKEFPASAPEETGQEMLEGTARSAVEPKEIPTTTIPEEKRVDGEETRALPEDASTEPSSTIAAEETPNEKEVHKWEGSTETPITAADTIDRLTEETSKEAKPEEGTPLPVSEDAVEENPAGEDGSTLETQPSLSMYIPKPGQATAAERETPEDSGLTTPRGTPLMQRVEQLEDKLAHLESRQSPRSDFASTGHSTPRSSIDKPFKHSTRYVLEATGSKGTLMDRVGALEQKLAHINLHPPSPSYGHSTSPVATVAEDSGSEPNLKPAESQTREWTPGGTEGEKAPEQVKSEEASKAAKDPVKPNMEEKSPQVPDQTKPVASARSNSFKDKKIKAKATAGKVRGIFAGCFRPKKIGTPT